MFIKGIVTRIESKHYYVLPETGRMEILCSLRGKLKKAFNLKKDKLFHKDIAAVGDFIKYRLNTDGTGVIEEIEERTNYISRKAPKIKGSSYRGERLEQIIASNVDRFFIMSSIERPPFNNRVVDRFLAAAESSHIHPIIIINKKDLESENISEQWYEFYKEIGYEVIVTSVKTGENIPELRKLLRGKKNLFWGQSGVGKSSILNIMFPELKLKIGEISSWSEKGTHKTVTSVMLLVENNTYIIDTPGVREMDPFGIKKEDLGHYFNEFSPYINYCRFNTCTHCHEPGCAVKAAVQNGKISEIRYDSYLRLLDTVEEDLIF